MKLKYFNNKSYVTNSLYDRIKIKSTNKSGLYNMFDLSSSSFLTRLSNKSDTLNSTKFNKNTNNTRNKVLYCFNKSTVHSSNVFEPFEESKSNEAKIGEVVLTTKHGVGVLLDPLLNKGTGFSVEERERLGIRGLIPPRTIDIKSCLEWQAKKIMMRYYDCPTNIVKYSYFMSLQDRNEVLFYKCLVDNLEELAPVVYTPTVGEACLKFAYLFRRPRGMYFSAADKGNMHAMAFNWPTDDVELIVVTDGSRILGLGDLGVNGMGIPIGKLALYTACAGIHPSKCLPIVIDVGTNNQNLLDNELYLGLQQRRVVGDEYDEIIDEFIRAVSQRFPKALIQFEDFSTENASRILNKYRNKVLCFNDDMQGTATIALAGVLSALKSQGYSDPQKELQNQRIVVAGAGTAGLGVAKGLLYNMTLNGLSEQEAAKRFWVLDDKGLIGGERRTEFKNQLKWRRNDYQDKLSLLETVKQVKPTIILGLTGVGGIFTEEIIKEMAKHVKVPIIFPLSNPTSKAECTAENAYRWTDGKCIFASGSPFKEVEYNGKILKPAQSNNIYTYPGLGLGALAGEARMITDNMLNAVAMSVIDSVKEADYKEGRLFPKISKIPELSKSIALAVAKQAFKDGVVKYETEKSDAELVKKINQRYWRPFYGSLVRIDQNRY